VPSESNDTSSESVILADDVQSQPSDGEKKAGKELKTKPNGKEI